MTHLQKLFFDAMRHGFTSAVNALQQIGDEFPDNEEGTTSARITHILAAAILERCPTLEHFAAGLAQEDDDAS
jgi:hypothetical protein